MKTKSLFKNMQLQYPNMRQKIVFGLKQGHMFKILAPRRNKLNRSPTLL